MRLLAVAVISAVLFFPNFSAYADDPVPDHTRSIVGTVTAIDWVGSTLTVSDYSFRVPDGIDVRKGADTISFNEVNVGDQVMVRYTEDTPGRHTARALVVQYNGEFAV